MPRFPLGPLVDVETLVEVLYPTELPMDFALGLANLGEYHPLPTDSATDESTDLRPLITDEAEVRLALRATASLPFLAGPPVELRGRRFLRRGVMAYLMRLYRTMRKPLTGRREQRARLPRLACLRTAGQVTPLSLSADPYHAQERVPRIPGRLLNPRRRQYRQRGGYRGQAVGGPGVQRLPARVDP